MYKITITLAKFRIIEHYLDFPNWLRQDRIKLVDGTHYFLYRGEWIDENKAYKIAMQNKRDYGM